MAILPRQAPPSPPLAPKRGVDLLQSVQAGLLAGILGVGSWAVLTTDSNKDAIIHAADGIAEMRKDVGRIESSVADIKTAGAAWAQRQGDHNDKVDQAFTAINLKLNDHGQSIAELSDDVAELKTPQVIKVPVPQLVPVPTTRIIVHHDVSSNPVGDALNSLFRGRRGSGRRPGQRAR